MRLWTISLWLITFLSVAQILLRNKNPNQRDEFTPTLPLMAISEQTECETLSYYIHWMFEVKSSAYCDMYTNFYKGNKGNDTPDSYFWKSDLRCQQIRIYMYMGEPSSRRSLTEGWVQLPQRISALVCLKSVYWWCNTVSFGAREVYKYTKLTHLERNIENIVLPRIHFHANWIYYL